MTLPHAKFSQFWAGQTAYGGLRKRSHLVIQYTILGIDLFN